MNITQLLRYKQALVE